MFYEEQQQEPIMWLCNWRVQHNNDDDLPLKFASMSEIDSFAEVPNRDIIPFVVFNIQYRDIGWFSRSQRLEYENVFWILEAFGIRLGNDH